MNTPEVITAIVAPCALGAVGIFAAGVAREWWHFSWSMSLRMIPAHKRQPRVPVELVNVIPGAVEQATAAAPVVTVRRTG